MVRRYELSDATLALVGDLLPANGRRGRQWYDHRTALNGIFWILHSGAQWRELPERDDPRQTVYWRYIRWRRDGTIDRMLERLHLAPDADGRIDVELGASTRRRSVRVERRRGPVAWREKTFLASLLITQSGARARRLRHEAPPGGRRWRRPAGGDAHPRGGARIAAGRAHAAPRPPAAPAHAVARARRRQGLQPSRGAPLLATARHSGRDPNAVESAPTSAVRQAHVPAAQYHRARRRAGSRSIAESPRASRTSRSTSSPWSSSR